MEHLSFQAVVLKLVIALVSGRKEVRQANVDRIAMRILVVCILQKRENMRPNVTKYLDGPQRIHQ